MGIVESSEIVDVEHCWIDKERHFATSGCKLAVTGINRDLRAPLEMIESVRRSVVRTVNKAIWS